MARPVLPDAYVTVLDGALGLASDFPSGVFAQVGRASQGPYATPRTLTEADQVAGVFGEGELPLALRLALVSGARMVLGVRTRTSQPGSLGSIQRVGLAQGLISPVVKQGTGSGTVSMSGSPLEGVQGLLELQIVDGGEVGTATFRWRFNGGSWSQPIATAGSVLLASLGVTVAWQAGAEQPSFVADDLFACHLLRQGLGSMAATGDPTIDGRIEVQITGSGTLNQAKFRYRLDGQSTWSPEQTVQATCQVPGTGVTLQFTEGDPANYSFLSGERFGVPMTGPTATVEDLMEAIDSLLAVNYPVEFLHVVGPTGPSVWAALQAKAEEFESQYRYLHVLAEARGPAEAESADEWVAALLQQAESFAGTRVSVCAGRAYIEYMGHRGDINAAALYAARLSRIGVQQSPGRIVDGSLPLAIEVAPVDSEGRSLINDGHIALLDATGKFVTVRRYVGQAGVFVTNGRMKVNQSSDFRWVEWRRVMDKACREVRLAALRSVHKEATPEGLRALQADCQQPLDIMRGAGEVYDARASIPDGQDFLATSTVKVKIRIQPVPTMRWIEVEMGFENPFRGGGEA